MAGTGGSSSSCQPNGSVGSASGPGYAVFWLWMMEPSGRRALEPDLEPRADVHHLAVGWRFREALAHLGEVVEPADEDEAGDERGAGQVVEQQVQRRAVRRLPGQFCRDRLAQVAPGPAADKPLQPGRRRIRLNPPNVALGPGHRVEVGLPDDRGFPVEPASTDHGPVP